MSMATVRPLRVSSVRPYVLHVIRPMYRVKVFSASSIYLVFEYICLNVTLIVNTKSIYMMYKEYCCYTLLYSYSVLIVYILPYI